MFEGIPEEQKNKSFKNINQTIKTMDPLLTKMKPKTENFQFFGKPCKVIENNFMKVYLWNGQILRHETKLPFKIIKEIEEMKINVEISPDYFVIPQDIKIQEITNKNLKTHMFNTFVFFCKNIKNNLLFQYNILYLYSK